MLCSFEEISRSQIICNCSLFHFHVFILLKDFTYYMPYCLILSPGKYGHNDTDQYISVINPHIRAKYELQPFHKLIYTWYSVPLLLITVLTCLSTVLLLLYLIKCFRKLLSYCGPKKYHVIYVFIDTFQSL